MSRNPQAAFFGHDPAIYLADDDISREVRRVLVSLETRAVRRAHPLRELGSPGQCWLNVDDCVRREGGSLVMGWSVCVDEPPLPQSNKFARLSLNAHAVWEHEGVLHETCPERIGKDFIPDNPFIRCRATIEFYDTAAVVFALIENGHPIPTCSHLVPLGMPAVPEFMPRRPSLLTPKQRNEHRKRRRK